MKTIISRNQLFIDFKRHNPRLLEREAILAFNQTTDQVLAHQFNLKVFRKGFFIN